MVAKHRARDFLRRVNRERGVTVLLTTHDVVVLEQLCSRLLIVDRGRLLYDGGLDQMRERLGAERTLVVDLAEDGGDAPLEIPGAREVRREGPRHWLRFRRADATAAELIAAVAARYRVRDLSIEEPAIEEIIRRIYERGL